MTDARAVKLEILQKHHQGSSHGVIVPDALFINDVEVLLPHEATIEIGPVSPRDCLTATVTFFVEELIIRGADDIEYDIPWTNRNDPRRPHRIQG